VNASRLRVAPILGAGIAVVAIHRWVIACSVGRVADVDRTRVRVIAINRLSGLTADGWITTLLSVARVTVVADRRFIRAETVLRITRVHGTSVVIVANRVCVGTDAVLSAGIFGAHIRSQTDQSI
jgi:hypothetical protein